MVAGAAEAYADVTGCAADEKGFVSVRALPVPADLQVEVRAVGAVGRP